MGCVATGATHLHVDRDTCIALGPTRGWVGWRRLYAWNAAGIVVCVVWDVCSSTGISCLVNRGLSPVAMVRRLRHPYVQH